MAACSLTPEEISKLYEEAEDEVEEAAGDIHFSEKQMTVLENCGMDSSRTILRRLQPGRLLASTSTMP
jgi:hypothetical protein